MEAPTPSYLRRRSADADGCTFVGLDVHKETIAVAVAETGGEGRALGTLPNTGDAVQKLNKKLGTPDTLRVCYEAGPCGYVLYW